MYNKLVILNYFDFDVFKNITKISGLIYSIIFNCIRLYFQTKSIPPQQHPFTTSILLRNHLYTTFISSLYHPITIPKNSLNQSSTTLISHKYHSISSNFYSNMTLILLRYLTNTTLIPLIWHSNTTQIPHRQHSRTISISIQFHSDIILMPSQLYTKITPISIRYNQDNIPWSGIWMKLWCYVGGIGLVFEWY